MLTPRELKTEVLLQMQYTLKQLQAQYRALEALDKCTGDGSEYDLHDQLHTIQNSGNDLRAVLSRAMAVNGDIEEQFNENE